MDYSVTGVRYGPEFAQIWVFLQGGVRGQRRVTNWTPHPGPETRDRGGSTTARG